MILLSLFNSQWVGARLVLPYFFHKEPKNIKEQCTAWFDRFTVELCVTQSFLQSIETFVDLHHRFNPLLVIIIGILGSCCARVLEFIATVKRFE